MAKVIATIGGIGLAPGISRNRRLYTSAHIASAVGHAQERLKSGAEPMVMLTHHAAEDDSRAIAATLTGMSLDEDGRIRWTAGMTTDTPAGRDIAALADTTDGQPAHLKGVSIRGHWTGTVRKVKGPDGDPVETADGLEIDGLDFTRKPGVPEAGVDTFAWSAPGGAAETTEWVFITESVQEARVTAISEETMPVTELAPSAETRLEALRDLYGLVDHVFEDGLCVTCARVAEGGNAPGDGSKPYGNVTYADPGYQSDKKKRYPVDSKAHAKSAWSYVHKAGNAAKYSANQLKRIKGRIMAALKRFGVKVSTSESWVVDRIGGLSEAIAEHYSDGDNGSFSISLNNGAVSVCVSSYSIDPDDLDIVATAAMRGACAALGELDPDMDGDIDVPGADAEDDDGDNDNQPSYEPPSPPGETAPPPTEPAVRETSPPPATATKEQEAPAMTAGTTTVAEAQIPASAGDPTSPDDPNTDTNPLNDSNPRDNQDDASGNNFEAFLADMIDLVARKAAADGKTNPAYAQLVRDLIMSQALGQNGPLASASVALTGAGSVPAPTIRSETAPAAPVAEHARPGETVQEMVKRMVDEGVAAKLTEERQRLTEQGAGPVRKGLVRPVGETAEADATALPDGWPSKPLDQYTNAEWAQYVEPHVADAVLGNRGAPAGRHAGG